MRRLPLEYKKNGHLFKQVRRNEKVAIYEQFIPETWRSVGYEVFEIVIYPPIGEQPEREYPPSNEQWGIKGWTTGKLYYAEKLFNEITERVHPKKIENALV